MVIYKTIKYCKNSLDIEKTAYFLHQGDAENACKLKVGNGGKPADFDDYEIIPVREYTDKEGMYVRLKEEKDAKSRKHIPNYITKETVAQAFKSNRNDCGHNKEFFDNSIRACMKCLAEIDNLEIEALQSQIRFLKKALDSAESGSYHRR